MSLKIIPILCNKDYMDNYSYLVIDKDTGVSAIVDASEATPIINKCEKLQITPKYILVTHHHYDHNGGNMELKEKYNLQIIGSFAEKEKMPDVDVYLRDNDMFVMGNSCAKVILVKGHTQGHLMWYFAEDKSLFTGDMLFNLSIGGMFEGTALDMWNSVERIKQLPDDVKFYPGHEYTKSGLGYVLRNKNLQCCQEYLNTINEKIEKKHPLVGMKLGLEKNCNPYLKYDNFEDFKDIF